MPALKKCELNLGETIANETANNHPDWKRLCQHVGTYVTLIEQKL